MGIITTKLSHYLFSLRHLFLYLRSKWFSDIFHPKELRKWAGIFSITNIIATIFFYFWHLEVLVGATGQWWLIFWTIIHLFIGARFIKNMQKFGRLAFFKWAWLNLLPISPIGLVLLYYVSLPKYWILDEAINKDKELLKKELEKDSKKKQLKFSYKKLEAKFNLALAYLKKINESIAREILQEALQITHDSFEDLSFYQISAVIALATICKQCKQKKFDNLVWGAHWYENYFFTFGFKNPKPISMFNKYPMTVGAVVLDELNNYRKIIEAKNQIKKNLAFSNAKMISLHMGSEYKLFVNQ